MKLPPDPYGSIPTVDRVKLQSYVPEAVKDRLMLVIPNRDIYTLLINHAIRRTVSFIDTNSLSYVNPGDSERLLDFIINGDPAQLPTVNSPYHGLCERATPRLAGNTVPRDDARTTARVRTAPKVAKNKSTDVR